ncbi:hypothetical protein Y032_0285g1371 [Ancylostoma ceylanicum]|uniref:DDE Tnp4 domain-containing protein n=1 Tax=Ancylostoma ceylanicum TaxID=53326 RepID=A0A016S6A3_9BILA|nr:hypothetical protein Y032_0285g1371 [Ancylostoma ceylanicum]
MGGILSGFTFFNYKRFYSIVSLALVDANYRCLVYDLEAHFGGFPPPVKLGNVSRVAHHVLVDHGFRHTIRFMKPFRRVDALKIAKYAYFVYKMEQRQQRKAICEQHFVTVAEYIGAETRCAGKK